MERKDQTAVIIGRMQVPRLHLGHIYLIAHALQNYQRVIILLGVSETVDNRNPYSYQYRRDAIRTVFGGNGRVLIGPLFDIPDKDEEWSKSIDNKLEPYNNPVLLHSRDSFKDHYRGKYKLVELPELPGYSGTELRKSSK